MAEGKMDLGRRVAVTLMAALGMGVVLGLLGALLDPMVLSEFMLSRSVWAHLGLGIAGGALLAAFYGRTGILGWGLSFLCGAGITGLAGMVAPHLSGAANLAAAQAALEAIGRDADILGGARSGVAAALLESPFLALLWIALVSAVHLAAGALRDQTAPQG